jgi:hypothetical protein
MGVMAAAQPSEGLKSYYQGKIEEFELAVRDKTQNLRRLEAQRNELNGKGAPLLFARISATEQSSGGTHPRVATVARRAAVHARTGGVVYVCPCTRRGVLETSSDECAPGSRWPDLERGGQLLTVP